MASEGSASSRDAGTEQPFAALPYCAAPSRNDAIRCRRPELLGRTGAVVLGASCNDGVERSAVSVTLAVGVAVAKVVVLAAGRGDAAETVGDLGGVAAPLVGRLRKPKGSSGRHPAVAGQLSRLTCGWLDWLIPPDNPYPRPVREYSGLVTMAGGGCLQSRLGTLTITDGLWPCAYRGPCDQDCLSFIRYGLKTHGYANHSICSQPRSVLKDLLLDVLDARFNGSLNAHQSSTEDARYIGPEVGQKVSRHYRGADHHTRDRHNLAPRDRGDGQ